MEKKIVILLMSLMSMACSSQRSSLDLDDEIYRIINLELENNESINLYFKSYSNEEYDEDYIRTSGSGYNCMLDVVNPDLVRRKLDSIEKISSLPKGKRDSLGVLLVKKNTIQEVWKSLPQTEAEQLSKNYISRVIKWDRAKIEDYEMRIVRKKWNRKFSVPVFNNDKTLAMMFIEYPNSLASHFYIKKNGTWYSYCSSIIRLDD